MGRFVLRLCVIVAAGLPAACTTVDRGAAVDLAAAGSDLSLAMHDEAAASRAAFRDDGRRADLLFLLGRAAASPAAVPTHEIAAPHPARAANEERRRAIALVLLRREQMLAALAAAYVEFGALAAGQPGADARAAVAAFTGQADLFMAAVGLLPGAGPMGRTATAAAAEAVALVVEERQRRAVKETSAAIRAALSATAEALRAESRVAASMRETSAASRTALRAALFDAGLADHGATVHELAALAGATPAEGAAARLSGDARLRAAVEAHLQTEQRREAAAVREGYAALLDALEALVAEHARLEADAPVDLAAILAWADRIEDIALTLRESRGE